MKSDVTQLPLVLGITGHRNLRSEDVGVLRRLIHEFFADLQEEYPHTPLMLISPLAEGADRIAAEVALESGIDLIVPLPMPVRLYERDFESWESLGEFRGLLKRAKHVFELPLIFAKVLDKCPEAQLIIIGSDSSDIRTGADSTWSLIQNRLNGKLISKVKYLGKIPHQQVQDYIKKANVCVFPTFAETQGMVTIESMAMHKPVVNSDMGWSREMIEDGTNGFLVNPKNHTQYAQRIIDLIQNEALCFTIGEAAKARVISRFDIQKLAKENIDFYKSII